MTNNNKIYKFNNLTVVEVAILACFCTCCNK